MQGCSKRVGSEVEPYNWGLRCVVLGGYREFIVGSVGRVTTRLNND